MALESTSLKTDFKSFLSEATRAYAEGVMTEYEEPGGGKRALFASGDFLIIDTWDQSQDQRVYNGNETVFKSGDLIWKSSYHGSVGADADPDEILDIYGQALRQPEPELPIRGPRRLQIGDAVYTLDSVRGPLTVARFAVIEEIQINGKRAYDGNLAGGWMPRG